MTDTALPAVQALKPGGVMGQQVTREYELTRSTPQADWFECFAARARLDIG